MNGDTLTQDANQNVNFVVARATSNMVYQYQSVPPHPRHCRPGAVFVVATARGSPALRLVCGEVAMAFGWTQLLGIDSVD